MPETIAPQLEDDAVIGAWGSRAPLVCKLFARIGLPGTLIFCFIVFLLVGLAVRCWLVVHLGGGLLRQLQKSSQYDIALRHAELAMITSNIVTAIVAVPVILLLIHRIFEPIRQLVSATDRIAAGDLDAQVAIHRPDAIGTLARSFNKMARRVRRQQNDLEESNHRLARANADLEDRIRQRTGQLEAANHRLSLEVAEKEDFLRAVSHDLSAPLRNISGMAAMLLHKNRNEFDKEVIHRLERIQKNVEVETDLITELLELSKIKTRRQRMAETDLNKLVREVAGLFEGDFHSRGIHFIVETSFPMIWCERPRFRQVFQNLIDNAVKYMGTGRLEPGKENAVKEIRVGSVVRGDEIDFYVRDTGMGIDEEDQDMIFYVFRRGRNAAVRAITGKGVGLASVKSIIETYNGNIAVESAVGCGSTFSFTINGKYLVDSEEMAGTL